jgi:cbb3-type cytochrome oxidase subunit 3
VSVDPAGSHYFILVIIFLLVLLAVAAIALLPRARRKGRGVLEV